MSSQRNISLNKNETEIIVERIFGDLDLIELYAEYVADKILNDIKQDSDNPNVA